MSEQVRRHVDSWAFWMVLAYAGIVCVIVWSLTLSRQQSRDEATHSAEIQANAQGQYVACLKSIPELGKINRFVRGVQHLHIAQEQNALAALDATDRRDPLYAVRLQSYRRFKQAADEVGGVQFHVPTRADCVKLRRNLLARS